MTRQMKTFAGAIVMALAASMVMSAQAPVTLTLRSGETIAATLVDLGGRGFEVRVAGAERLIPKGDVAVVDFGTPVNVQSAWFNGMAGQHLVVFKNGDRLFAEWDDVGGTSPLVLRFKTAQGDRELSSNDVARIYLVAPANIGSGVAPSGVADGTVTVPATVAWTSTGMNVRSGEFLRFGASGEIRWGTAPGDSATADGNPAGKTSTSLFRRLPVASMPLGGLVGRVGNGTAFAIGTSTQPIRMPASGTLMLGINDTVFTDNSGAFQVTVTRGQAPDRR